MKQTYIVGIAGGTASGKSTFAKELERMLSEMPLVVFHLDAYFKPIKERPLAIAPITGKKYVDDNHPMTMDLAKLAQDLEKAKKAKKNDIIIIEGLLTLWDDTIYSMLDLKLFMECRSDERLVRRIKRNIEWGQTFEQITEVYLDLVRFRHDEFVESSKWRADIILNGANSTCKSLEIIAQHIRSVVQN